MGEILKTVEGDKSVRAYIGTSIDNIRTCAFIDGGQVYFDKSREPRHKEPDCIQFECDLENAITWAAVRAKKLHHSPAILEGNVDGRFQLDKELPKGSCFPVNHIYIPLKEWMRLDDIISLMDSLNYERKLALEVLKDL